MNLAPFRAVDDLDGHEFNPFPRGGKRQQLFRLNFELLRAQSDSIERGKLNQAKTALAVSKLTPRQLGKFSAHPAIHHAPHPRHLVRLVHAITHNQRSVRLVRCPQELWDIGRRVLSVAVHAERPGKVNGARAPPARRQGSTLPLRGSVRKDGCTCSLCLLRRLIRRAIVNDQHARQNSPDLLNQSVNARALVAARNHDCALLRPIHRGRENTKTRLNSKHQMRLSSKHAIFLHGKRKIAQRRYKRICVDRARIA
jgi:hypothetical protein